MVAVDAPTLPPRPSPNVVLAADMAYKTWSYDPISAGTPLILTSGTIYLVRLQCRRPETWTNLHVGMSTAGSTLTAGQSLAGVYDSTGSRVASTATLVALFTGSTGELTLPLATPLATTPGFYWAAVLSVGTTPPTLVRGAGSVGGLGQGAAAAGEKRFGTIGTSQTALPSSFTPSSGITATVSNTYWVAVS